MPLHSSLGNRLRLCLKKKERKKEKKKREIIMERKTKTKQKRMWHGKENNYCVKDSFIENKRQYNKLSF